MGVGPITQSKGAKRPLDAELNLVPFIDLLVCCICFLLITAVWTQMARVDVHVGAEKGKHKPSIEMSPARVAVLVDQSGYTLTAGAQRLEIPMQGAVYDQQRLGEQLADLRAKSSSPPPITVAVADGVHFRHVVKVIDIAKAARYQRVRLSGGNMSF